MQRALDRRLLRSAFTPGEARKLRLLALLWLVAAVYFWAWWLRPEHIHSLWLFTPVTLALAWLFLLQVFFIWVLLQAKRSAAPDPTPGAYRVAMVVTKTPSEPLSLLKKTLLAMLAQDYPHDCWLADEDPSPATLAWCKAHGVHISSRRGKADYHRPSYPRRTRCKEGNLAYFYDHWGYRDYDIVVQLDADHVPQPGYLREMLRPFADPAVGYVSAPSICSANAAQSWAARSRLFTEAAFHGIFQAGYTAVLAPMCIGSHYAVRTRALREIGGLGPELAEDHSTTMLMNAGGWRGVHALDAIAYGDGPANVADLATQEFQWSRSLVTLLLSHSPRHLPALPPRLRFLFVFCQSLYPAMVVNMALLYLAPIAAVLFDIRYADVTYPAFVGHALLPLAAIVAMVFALRRGGYLRPHRTKILAWEKALFVLTQWPWNLWGCAMALRDRLAGDFVDFRVTPKGEGGQARLPLRLLLVYAALALGCLLPVIWVQDLVNARGFYLLAAFNGFLYTILVAVLVAPHLRAALGRAGNWHAGLRARGEALVQGATLATLVVILVEAIGLRGAAGAQALAIGLEPLRITRVEFTVAGAGMGEPGRAVVRFAPDLRAWARKVLEGSLVK